MIEVKQINTIKPRICELIWTKPILVNKKTHVMWTVMGISAEHNVL